MTANGDGQRLRGMRSSIRRNMRKLRKSLHKPSDHLPSRSSTMKEGLKGVFCVEFSVMMCGWAFRSFPSSGQLFYHWLPR